MNADTLKRVIRAIADGSKDDLDRLAQRFQLQVVVSIGKESFDSYSFAERMFITHRGLSGPPILQISSYWDVGKSIRVDLAPGCDVTAACA